jgi:hypothetical protein
LHTTPGFLSLPSAGRILILRRSGARLNFHRTTLSASNEHLALPCNVACFEGLIYVAILLGLIDIYTAARRAETYHFELRAVAVILNAPQRRRCISFDQPVHRRRRLYLIGYPLG